MTDFFNSRQTGTRELKGTGGSLDLNISKFTILTAFEKSYLLKH